MQTAFVTGGSGGIGSAIAIKLKKCGYNVVIGYFSNGDAAKKLAAEIGAASVFVDVSDEKSVKEAFLFVREKFGRIRVLVNCAGVALAQNVVTSVSVSDFDCVFGVNVRGVFNCSKEVIPDMLYLEGGDIVNISSVWGIEGGSCEVVYSASKGAVNAFTKALALELGPSGVKVNAVAPSFVRTKVNAHLTEEDERLFLAERALSSVTTCEQVADAVASLIKGKRSGRIVRVENKA